MPITFTDDIPTLRDQWRTALASLPSTPDNIPAFFLAHGQPMIIWPKDVPPPDGRLAGLYAWGGRDGPLAQFLDDFGPVLLEKYKPKGIVVFSAHWETEGERLVTDYGNENPLLMDYYGFMPQLYKVEFHSRGDSSLTTRVLDAFKNASPSIPARATPKSEPRGRDGRPWPSPPGHGHKDAGLSPPGHKDAGAGLDPPHKDAGLDHGVFVPFIRMFGITPPQSLPIVEVSIDGSLDPGKNWAVGEAVAELRKEGYLVIAGGLTIHSFENNMQGFSIKTAAPVLKEFDSAVIEAAGIEDPTARRAALLALTSHHGFRKAHPREEHFIPLYVAAGAGGGGGSKVLSQIYGQSSFAFGL